MLNQRERCDVSSIPKVADGGYWANNKNKRSFANIFLPLDTPHELPLLELIDKHQMDCDEGEDKDHVESQPTQVNKRRCGSGAVYKHDAHAHHDARSRVVNALPLQQRRLWVRDRKGMWWKECNSADYPEAKFRQNFRMGRATFDMVCDALESTVAKEDTALRPAIPVRQRVAVCIWRLATGEPLRQVGDRFGIGISTCHKLILDVSAAICSILMPQYIQWTNEAAVYKAKFEKTSGIPDVIGAMCTTHIPIIAPKMSTTAYYNRHLTECNKKASYSITLQGVVGPDGTFADVCIGWPGSMSDDQILDKSALKQRAAAGMMADSWVVGSTSYPLTDWILVPYTNRNLTWIQHTFNEKVAKLQHVAVNAFARLKGRWACLQKRTEVKLQDLPNVIAACCVLHNICEVRREKMEQDLCYDLVDYGTVLENPVRSESGKAARDKIANKLLHHNLDSTTLF